MINTDGNQPLFVYVSDSIGPCELPCLHFDYYVNDNDNFGGGGFFLLVIPRILEEVRSKRCKIVYGIPDRRHDLKREYGFRVPTHAEIALIEALMITGVPKTSEYDKLREEIYLC